MVSAVCFERATDAMKRRAGPHHEVFDKELAPTVEQFSQREFSFWGVEEVLLLHFYPGKFETVPGYFIAQVRQFLLAFQQILASNQPLGLRDDFMVAYVANICFSSSIVSICIFSLLGLMISLGFPAKFPQGQRG